MTSINRTANLHHQNYKQCKEPRWTEVLYPTWNPAILKDVKMFIFAYFLNEIILQ